MSNNPATLARYEGSSVLVGDLKVDCGTESITPLEEKYLEDKFFRSATWELSGVPAEEVVTRVIDEAVASKGLKRGALFGPAKGGRETWVGEAYSSVELVKARATNESGKVLLEIDIVDKRPHR